MEINKIKTITLKDKSIEGLAKKIEDFQNSNSLISKGSLPFYDSNNKEFCVIMFFPKGDTEIKFPKGEPVREVIQETESKTTETTTPKAPFNSNYKPSQEQLERWKKIKPTKKTIEVLKKLKFTDEELKEVKTQYSAHVILNSLVKENI